jgi:hypothetical protein
MRIKAANDYDDVVYYSSTIDVWEDEKTRVSALLGPDGHPLIIDLPRHRIGFDLTPKR